MISMENYKRTEKHVNKNNEIALNMFGYTRRKSIPSYNRGFIP